MNCQKISNQPELALDSVAGSGDREFERHLEECAECAKVVAAQREVWESLGRLNVPEVSSNFDARLYARIAREEAQPSWRRWLNRWLHPAVPMAAWKPAVAMAAVVVAIGVSIFPVRTPETPAIPEATVHAAHVDIEQVANTLDELDILMPTPASKSVM